MHGKGSIIWGKLSPPAWFATSDTLAGQGGGGRGGCGVGDVVAADAWHCMTVCWVFDELSG